MKKLFSKNQKIIFATIFLLSFFSGIIWLILRYFAIRQYEDFGSQLLMIHGICGLILIFIFGIIWAEHAKYKLKIKQKKNRKTGLQLLFLLGVICISSAGLYYIGNESLRNFVSILHWVLGIILPVIIIIHVPFSRR